MNKETLSVGTVVWEMHGIRRNGKIKWYARPECIEEVDKHYYRFANGNAISHNCIGKNTYLSRQECLDNFLKKHGGLEEEIGVNDPLSTKLANLVTELPRTDWEDYEIYPNYALEKITRIFVNDKPLNMSGFCWESIPEDDWRNRDAGVKFRMTLNQLSTQCYALLGHSAIITVVVEEPTGGIIFQIGNSPGEPKWEKHGTTKGYA